MKRFASALILWLTLPVLGCSSDSSGPAGAGTDCASSCTIAQGKSCTNIKGDCSQFCTSLDAVGVKASCKTQSDAYENCVISSPVCTSDDACASQKSAFVNCAVPFCALHSTDTDCQTVKTALL
jgi:hypothetical protein